jgi:hypothetical protein
MTGLGIFWTGMSRILDRLFSSPVQYSLLSSPCLKNGGNISVLPFQFSSFKRLREYNGGCELVQSAIYTSMELSQ